MKNAYPIRCFVAGGAILLAAAACSTAQAVPTASTSPSGPSTNSESSTSAGHSEGGGHTAGTVDSAAPAIQLTAKDLFFEPREISAKAGQPFTVKLNNQGKLEHDFVIEGYESQGGAHALTGSEAAATFTLNSGTYEFYCSVPGHREAGMQGTLSAG